MSAPVAAPASTPPPPPRAAPAAAAARRPLAGLPGVLRAAGGELLHHHRAADQRGLRLHLDADQPAARRAAHPPRGRVRRRRQTFRSEIYAEYKANRVESPTDFRGQVSLIQEVLDALRIPVITAENYEADDVIATLTTQAVEQGMDVLICTGDRDALQLVNDARHRALPAQGRLRPDPVHAGGGRGQVRPDARRSTPTSRRCAATRATTCPASRAWGRRPPPSGSASSARSTRWSTGSTRSRARSATRCASTCPRCCEPPAHRAGPRGAARRWARSDLAVQAVGPRRGAHALRQPAVPGAARAAVRHADQRRARGRGRLRRRRSTRLRARASSARGWTSTPAPAGPGSSSAAPGAGAPAS